MADGMKDLVILDPNTIAATNVPAIDCHLHTSWTDGENTASEMHGQAARIGIRTVLFSEHGRKTSIDWFPRFAANVRSLPSDTCSALVGVECKIEDFDGNIDTSPDIIALCDLVMASVHRFPDHNKNAIPFAEISPEEAMEIEFRLAWTGLANPKVDILGHPFGMCYRRYGVHPKDDQICALIERAAACDVAFEINSHYHPDPWRLVHMCAAAGARISLGSNAHRVEEVGKIVRVLEGQEAPWNPSECS